jgi:colanic acid/amylovoran biosynthesis glycosyltransferase
MKLVGQHLFENYLPIRQAYLYELLEALDRTGIINRVWSFKSSNLSLFPRQEVHVFHDASQLAKASVRVSSGLKGYQSYLSEYFLKGSSSADSQIVHAHFLWMSKTAQEIKRKRGVPIFLTAYGEDELFRAEKDPKVAEDVVNRFADFDVIITPSAYLANLIGRLIGEDDRLRLWHIGIDVRKYEPVLHESKDAYRVLCVSRLIDRKGLRYLVKAIPEVRKSNPNVTFTVIGEGPERSILLELAKKLGVSSAFEILPYQPSLVKEYSNADVFVLPSVLLPDGVTEGLGVPLLEAEASGLPIVATNVGGIPDAVEDGEQGFLVEPEQAEALADRILRLLGDVELRRKMGLAGQNKARTEFNVDVQALKLWNLYASQMR